MRTEIGEAGAAHLRLLTWFSPAFPVGAFAWSHGLETAIREGRVKDAADLRGWIEGMLEHGSGWTDAVLFKLAWDEPDRIAEIAELGEALAPSLERRRETMALGMAFTQAVRPWLASPPTLGDAVEGTALPYPVAAGAACASAGIPLGPALTAYLHAFAANLVSVGVRAVPIGQREAVTVLAALEPLILETAARAALAAEDDLGACAFLSEIAAMRHETLQPRLFIS